MNACLTALYSHRTLSDFGEVGSNTQDSLVVTDVADFEPNDSMCVYCVHAWLFL